ncbi:M24 family metallopeptidase [Actinospongicola halichondriae]|uniref:M24 family metallopeptidase n=1 Tax=Actinospongicola halichondriae TaxID=3236844 RepID=UPI003D38EC9E
MDELAPLETAQRIGRLRERFADEACDALVVTDLVNIRYLTGFTGSNAVLLVTTDDVTLVTDGRYRTQSAEQLEAAGVVASIAIANDPERELAAAARGITRIGLEADDVSWATQRRWATDTFSWAHLVPTQAVVLTQRAVKDEGEVDRLLAASAIADAALADVASRVHDGLTERAFRRELEDAMTDHGSDGPSFDTIIASGPNGAKPHARPTDRVIGSSGAGEFVVVDFGATVDGYHSDMTRTLPVGDLSPTQERMYEVVRASQAAGVEKVAAGIRCRTIDETCREVVVDAGWGDAFAHGTGHGIGLVIHESPRLASTSVEVLAPGHCVTVEPGVYLPEHGGVRIEDSVVVTATGCRMLTNAPYA